MVTTVSTAHRQANVSRLSPFGWAVTAAALLFVSAALQLSASLERWVTVSNSWTRVDSTVEDHTFDYFIPSDPWENLGSTAQVFGVGFLLLGFAVFAMSKSVPPVPGRFDQWAASVVAATFVIVGAHALISGLTGAPTLLQVGYLLSALSLISFLGLVLLAVRWLRRSPLLALACVLLLGVTAPGYIAATFMIAPAIMGYQSHDTTPHTESVLAAFTVASAVALLFVAAHQRRIQLRAATNTSHGDESS